MLIDAKRSALLLIDVQERLLGGIHESEALVNNCRWLMQVAKLMEVPVLASEQYPKGVGPTIGTLREMLPDEDFVAKTEFSCVDAETCNQRIQQLDRDQFVICGMEAHVCVLQTALRLREEGKTVYVVTDAISARSANDTAVAIERMREEGVKLVTREMVGFEWIRRSDAPQFKEFSINFLR